MKTIAESLIEVTMNMPTKSGKKIYVGADTWKDLMNWLTKKVGSKAGAEFYCHGTLNGCNVIKTVQFSVGYVFSDHPIQPEMLEGGRYGSVY